MGDSSRGRPRPAFRPQYGSHGDLYRGGLCRAAGAETSHPRINAYLSAKEVARHLARASFGGSCVPLKSSAATIQHAANQGTHPVRRLTVADVSSQRMGYGRRHLAPGITCDQIAWQKKPASATCHPARSGAVLDRVGRLGDLRGVKALLTLPEGRDGILYRAARLAATPCDRRCHGRRLPGGKSVLREVKTPRPTRTSLCPADALWKTPIPPKLATRKSIDGTNEGTTANCIKYYI